MRQTGTGPSAIAKFYHQDGLGSVVAVSTSTGTTDGTQRFDAWGNKTTVTGAAVATYGYTGREPDASGLTYYRARYYDPASRRFTQRDPIGFGGGDINLYAYVGNNPVNYTDPSGLLPTGPSNSNATSYPGNSSSGCLSQFTPGEEQTATDAVAEVEGIDFSNGPVLVAGQCLLNAPRDTISASNDLGIFIQSFASNLDVGDTLDQFGRKLAYDFVQNHKGEGQLYGLLVDQASGYAAGYDGASANGRMAGVLALGAMLRTPGGAKGATNAEQLVIGRGADLAKPGALNPGEFKFSWPPTGAAQSEWKVNSGLLRQEMGNMRPWVIAVECILTRREIFFSTVGGRLMGTRTFGCHEHREYGYRTRH